MILYLNSGRERRMANFIIKTLDIFLCVLKQKNTFSENFKYLLYLYLFLNSVYRYFYLPSPILLQEGPSVNLSFTCVRTVNSFMYIVIHCTILPWIKNVSFSSKHFAKACMALISLHRFLSSIFALAIFVQRNAVHTCKVKNQNKA